MLTISEKLLDKAYLNWNPTPHSRLNFSLIFLEMLDDIYCKQVHAVINLLNYADKLCSSKNDVSELLVYKLSRVEQYDWSYCINKHEKKLLLKKQFSFLDFIVKNINIWIKYITIKIPWA